MQDFLILFVQVTLNCIEINQTARERERERERERKREREKKRERERKREREKKIQRKRLRYQVKGDRHRERK